MGRFNANFGAANLADCDACPINSFQPAANGSACYPCPSGHHQPAPGSSTCIPCDAGMVFDESRGSCVVCPPSTSSVAGATSCDVCMPDRYRRDAVTAATTSSCVACPEGTSCGWNTTLATLNLTAGWWRVSGSSTELHRCDSWGHGRSSCAGGSWAGASGDGYCAEGFHGPLCATTFPVIRSQHAEPDHCTRCRCEICGDGLYYQDAVCHECPEASTWAGIAAGIIVGMLIVTFAIFALCSSRRRVMSLLRRLHKERTSSTLPRHSNTEGQPRHVEKRRMPLESFVNFAVWQLQRTAIVPKAKVCALVGVCAPSMTG